MPEVRNINPCGKYDIFKLLTQMSTNTIYFFAKKNQLHTSDGIVLNLVISR